MSNINLSDDNGQKIDTQTNMMADLLANPDKLISEKKRWNYNDGFDDIDELVDNYAKPVENQNPFIHPNDNNLNNNLNNNFSQKNEKNEKKENNAFNTFTDENTINRKDNSDNKQNKESKDEESSWSPEELMLKKLEMLRQLTELAQAGVKLSQNYNLQSDYKMMRYEYELHKGIRAKHNAVQWMSSMMLNGAYGLEMLNESYNPFNFKLKGWAEQMNSNITNYYDVLGELYEKYNKPGKGMAPEFKLLLMLTGGALQFHFTQTYMGQSISLNKNPELTEQLRKQAINNTKNRQEELNKKVSEAHLNVAKNLETRNENLAYIKQKELEKMKMDQMKEQQNIKMNEIKKNLANIIPINKPQPLTMSRPQLSSMPPLPINTSSNNVSSTQPTLQIHPSIAKMMEENEKKKAELYQQQSDLLKVQKEAIELNLKNEMIKELERAKELKQQEEFKDKDSKSSKSSKSLKSNSTINNSNISDILSFAKNNKSLVEMNSDDEENIITPVEVVSKEDIQKTNISLGSRKSSNTNKSKLTLGSNNTVSKKSNKSNKKNGFVLDISK